MNKHKGLYRSRTNTVIGGVAGGIAENLRTDPTLIRIIFILVALFGGGGLLVYVILWIALPLEPVQYFTDQNQNPENGKADPNFQSESFNEQNNFNHNKNQGNLIAGLIMISIGVIFLIDRFVPRIDFGDLWPLVLVIAGVALIRASYVKKLNDKEKE
ncbi:MAG: PspC domain-containing protein [Bacteroidales bacterium]|nr:PspC domain-containing protein [Bacteroidales bacterium]